MDNAPLWDGPRSAVTAASSWSRTMQRRCEEMRTAINGKLWNDQDGLYYDFDLTAGKLIERDTVFSYVPLFAGIPDRERGRRLMDTLRAHCFCIVDGDCVGVPSYDMCQADFLGEFYWRDPVWVNINWFLAQGLQKYGEEELAEWIERSLIALADRHGFHEYYDPETGQGLGERDFFWTTALVIALVDDGLRSRA